ncbi:MAG: sugar ABC transporter ATP-binding protein [Proteobacteria bacterium]|nr:sugar ABC transporter ATP-binding protein [Pseudomonadota bacterium]
MLELRSISKVYGSFSALKSVDLSLCPGEIAGLVGVNGSGKTTLLNILSGHRVIQDTGGHGGTFLFENKLRKFMNPGQAITAGIGMVHQEFALMPGLSVADNICLSRECVYPWSERFLGHDLGCINRSANRQKASKILQEIGIDLDPDLRAGDLSVALKQFVELAREVNRQGLKLLLLDEPTAVLGAEDALKMVAAVKAIAAQGIGVVYVSHRLGEVLACCDTITILRNGQVEACVQNDPAHSDKMGSHPGGLDKLKALSLSMTGKSIKKIRRSPMGQAKKKALTLSSFSVDKPGDCLENLTLDIFQGEILGITSLSGHGRTAIGPGIMGLFPARGKMEINGTPVLSFDPLGMIQKNIWMLPEDRSNHGLLLDHSLVENMTFAAIQAKARFVKKRVFPFLKFPFFSFPDQKQCQAYARTCQETLDIDCRSVFQKACELSGGNQQKVCIASALSMNPGILFATDPTRGIDMAAKEAILGLLIQAHKTHGMTLVVSSGEIDELRRICDRIAVLYQGRLFDVLTPDQSEAAFFLACSGMHAP